MQERLRERRPVLHVTEHRLGSKINVIDGGEKRNGVSWGNYGRVQIKKAKEHHNLRFTLAQCAEIIAHWTVKRK